MATAYHQQPMTHCLYPSLETRYVKQAGDQYVEQVGDRILSGAPWRYDEQATQGLAAVPEVTSSAATRS